MERYQHMRRAFKLLCFLVISAENLSTGYRQTSASLVGTNQCSRSVTFWNGFWIHGSIHLTTILFCLLFFEGTVT
jgi:hypothetical protein